MNKTIAPTTALVIAFLSVAVLAASKTKITGLYTDMYFSRESGDVGGSEIFIVYATDGLQGQHYAMVQMAEGVPEIPVLVKVIVHGEEIEFDLPNSAGEPEKFRGRVSATALTGSFEGSNQVFKLRRGRSYWQ